MFSNLSKREKALLVFLALLAGGVLFWFYIYEPAQEEIAGLESDVSSRETELNRAIERAGQLPELREEAQALRDRIQTLREQEKSVPDLLVMFNELAGDFAVELEDFSPYNTEEEIRLNLLLRGDYRNISDMLVEARRSDNRLELSRIDLQAPEDGYYLEAEILSIYYKYDF